MNTKAFIYNVLAIHVGIITAGIVLDEAGRGTFGGTISTIANKVTRGFGV